MNARAKILAVVIALVLGAVTGAIAGPRAAVLGDLGFALVQFIKVLATPLLFFAIMDALLSTEIPRRKGMKLLGISFTNAVVAFLLAVAVSHAFPVGKGFSLTGLQTAVGAPAGLVMHGGGRGFGDYLSFKDMLPKSLVEPFATNSVVSVIALALLFGFAMRTLRGKGDERARDFVARAESFIHGCLQIFLVILGWVVRFVPICVFGVVAKAVGMGGLSVLKALAGFVGVVTLGLLLQVAVYYSALLAAFARRHPAAFWRESADALLTAFSAGSSLAALPVTLRTLEHRHGISPGSARLAACIGTNLNHDGILLYEVAAAFFVAQLYGITMGFEQQATLALTSVVAAVGIAGIPDAGLITLSLVLGAVGLPLEAVPFLLPVDWILGRLRATTNVASDLTVAALLDRSGGRGRGARAKAS